MPFRRKPHWSADDVTAARELLSGGWHDARGLAGGIGNPRRGAKAGSHLEGAGYATSRKRGIRRHWRSTNDKALAAISAEAAGKAR